MSTLLPVPNNSGPGLLIGIPTLGRPVPLSWAFAFKSLNPPINYNSILQVIQGAAVADARNEMAKIAIEKGCKYVFFLGDDVVVPNHTLRQLIYRLEQDSKIDVVGGVYCAKCDPAYPLVFTENGRGAYWDWKIGEFFPVSGLGMDCTLIRVETLKKLSQPWFKTVEDDKFLDGKNEAESWTEDLWFFNKLKKEKPDAQIYCDGGVICEHHDVYGRKTYKLPLDSLPMRQMITKKDKKALRIGDGNSVAINDSYEIITQKDYRFTPNSLPFDSNDWDLVCVEDLKFEFIHCVEEWYRVLKNEGELVLVFNMYISLELVKQYLHKHFKFKSIEYNVKACKLIAIKSGSEECQA